MIFLIFFLLLFHSGLFAAQDFSLDFTYPDFEGDFYVSGTIVFPPSAVKSEDNIMLKAYSSGEEVPGMVTVLRKWADESILRAEIVFVANSSRPDEYIISYGEDVRRKKVFSRTAVLPTVLFSIRGSPKTSESMDVNVGRINVRVDRSSQIFYHWHIAPIILLISFSYLRYRRARASYEK